MPPRTAPLPNWTGEDAFIIGGGESLAGFDWAMLDGLNTIGCNQAFLLGASICNICTWGDMLFWEACVTERLPLGRYDGWVVTNYWAMNSPPWLKFYTRQEEGLGRGDVLAWNSNTGALAVNLALTLGAARVFLLGFDMEGGVASSHWHNHRLQSSRPGVYNKFISGFKSVRAALPQVFPGREVVNLVAGGGPGRLPMFRSEDRDAAVRLPRGAGIGIGAGPGFIDC